MNNKFKNFLIFLIPVIIFTILYFVYYPGIITIDGNIQWQQVQNEIISNAHPFFSTFFMLILSKVYNSTSTVLFFQIFMFSLIWTFICNYTRKTKKDFILQIIYTLIISCIPIISIYSITLWKDVLYSYYLLAIALLLYIGINKNFEYNKIEFFLFSLLLFLIFSYRHNGVIVSSLLILFIIVIFIKNKINITKILIIPTIFISLIIISFIPKNIYLSKSELNNELSVGSIDAYIFWMYGAHLNDNNIKNEDDLKFLNDIANINDWKESYDPYIINFTNYLEKDVKFLNNNIIQFRNLFIKTSIKKPLTILNHYLKADSLLINPKSKGYVYIYQFTDFNYPFEFENKELSKFPIIRKIYNRIVNLTYTKLIDPIFHMPANLMYMSILMAIILSKKLKNKKYYIILLPMLFNTLSLLPINLAQDLRYVYINYLTFFFMLLLFILKFNDMFKLKKKRE